MRRFWVILLLACGTASAQITVTDNAPFEGENVLAGAKRTVQVTVGGGTTNLVNWSVTSGSATLSTAFCTGGTATAATGCLQEIEFTAGPTIGNCALVGSGAPYSGITSNVTITLTATSAEDTTKSVSKIINVCGDTPQVHVAPHYHQAYEAQPLDLQSWVWGSVDETGTWSCVAMPTGATCPISDTAHRDAVFQTATPGSYQVRYASSKYPAQSDTAWVYVTPQALPYPIGASNQMPFPCVTDPTFTGHIYEVGPGQAYANPDAPGNFNDPTAYPPGSMLKIHNSDTTGQSPTVYPYFIEIAATGQPGQPIVVCGVPDSVGNLPIIDGNNATTAQTWVSWSVPYGGAGPGNNLISVFYPHDNVSNLNAPHLHDIVIAGLHVRNARAGLPYTGSATNQTAAETWGQEVQCISLKQGRDINIASNMVENCEMGIQTSNNDASGPGVISSWVAVQGNYLLHNGSATDLLSHDNYLQTRGLVYQFNHDDTSVAGAQGTKFKWRGQELVMRYNFIGSGAQRDLDLVDDEDDADIVSFNSAIQGGPPGSPAVTMNQIAAEQEANRKDFVYGNTLVNAAGCNNVHFGNDHAYDTLQNRTGKLYYWNNTMMFGTQVFDTSTGGCGANNSATFREIGTIVARNNIFWPSDQTNFAINAIMGTNFEFSTNLFYQGTVNLTTPIHGIHFNGGGTQGWANQQAQYGGTWQDPLDKHIIGLTAANFLEPSTATPFYLGTYQPQSTSAAVGAATTLTGIEAQLPLRFQFNAATKLATARLRPQDIGAMDMTSTAPVPTITGAAVTPSPAQVYVGTQKVLSCVNAYSDGSKSGSCSAPAWSSSNTSVATVSSSGIVTGASVGTATVTVTQGGYTAQVTVTVTTVALGPPIFGGRFTFSGTVN